MPAFLNVPDFVGKCDKRLVLVTPIIQPLLPAGVTDGLYSHTPPHPAPPLENPPVAAMATFAIVFLIIID